MRDVHADDWKIGHPDWIHVCDFLDMSGNITSREFCPVLKPGPTPFYDLLKLEQERKNAA